MRLRLDPARVDRLGAALLLVGVEVQVFLSEPLSPSTIAVAVVWGVVAASLAVRRRWPVVVGIGVQALMVAAQLLGRVLPGGPFMVSGPPLVAVAWFAALYVASLGVFAALVYGLRALMRL